MSRENKMRIWTLDGGGVRGVYTAELLCMIKNEINRPLVSMVDLVVGTSVGSIIAAAIALGVVDDKTWTDDRLRAVAPVAFASQYKRRSNPMLSPMFSAEGLHKQLKDLFRDMTMGDCVHGPRLAITTATTTGVPVIFCSWVKAHQGILVRDVVAASCTIPGVFPPQNIGGVLYVDGGVAMNDPIEAAVVLASEIEQKEGESGPMSVLSIGTTVTCRGGGPESRRSKALLYDAKRGAQNEDDPMSFGLLKFLELDIVAAMMGQLDPYPHMLVKMLIGDQNVLRIEPDVYRLGIEVSSSNITKKNLDALVQAANRTWSLEGKTITRWLRQRQARLGQ